MKVLLTSKPTFEGYSVEAGKADGQKHFDHHGDMNINPSPAANCLIPVIPEDSIVEITHIDADTLLGVARLMGKEMPNSIDLELLEQIDLNGSSVIKNKFDTTLCYMVGISTMSRDIKFPRCSEVPQDVTNLIEQLLVVPETQLIELGRASQEKAEEAYKTCKVAGGSGVGLWSIGPDDQLDPSRPYEDNVDMVVVYRQHYKSISIYCNPKSDYSFAGKEVGGILFQGHPKACGSPRGQEMTFNQAVQVMVDLVIGEVARVTSRVCNM